jgi:hypothetical protein
LKKKSLGNIQLNKTPKNLRAIKFQLSIAINRKKERNTQQLKRSALSNRQSNDLTKPIDKLETKQ